MPVFFYFAKIKWNDSAVLQQFFLLYLFRKMLRYGTFHIQDLNGRIYTMRFKSLDNDINK